MYETPVPRCVFAKTTRVFSFNKTRSFVVKTHVFEAKKCAIFGSETIDAGGFLRKTKCLPDTNALPTPMLSILCKSVVLLRFRGVVLNNTPTLYTSRSFSFFVLLLFLSVGVEGKISLRVIAVPPGVIIKDVNNPFAIFALKLISFEASSTSSSSSLVNARMLFKTSSFEKHKKRGHVFPSVIYTIPSLI